MAGEHVDEFAKALPRIVSKEGLDDMSDTKGALAAQQFNPDDFPSLDEAYALVQPAYDSILTRFESANTRLSTMLSMTSTVAIGAPILVATALPAQVKTESFVLSVLVWGLALVIGAWGLHFGGVHVIHPKKLGEKQLALSPETFKAYMLHWAALDFDDNLKMIEAKHTFGVVFSGLFGLGALILALGLAF